MNSSKCKYKSSINYIKPFTVQSNVPRSVNFLISRERCISNSQTRACVFLTMLIAQSHITLPVVFGEFEFVHNIPTPHPPSPPSSKLDKFRISTWLTNDGRAHCVTLAHKYRHVLGWMCKCVLLSLTVSVDSWSWDPEPNSTKLLGMSLG